MSVYKPKGRATYVYDFQYRGDRYTGDTRETNKRDAERFEAGIRASTKAQMDATERAGRLPLTWGAARARYWDEVGKHFSPPGDRQCKWSLGWLTIHIGADTQIATITNGKVAELVAKRRGDDVSPATVNRSVIEPLRKVLYRARDVWEEPVAKIAWGKHILPEPQERVRELSAKEEARLFEAMREDYRPIMRFALASGVRLSGCVKLTWPDVDWGNRKIAIKGKGGRDYTIPISVEIREILFPLQGAHDTAVFCYVAQRTRDGREAGHWYPITMHGLMTEWRRTIEGAGISDYRWHDHRHTRATRLLRQTGNLKMVQRLLGHTRIETTTRYAHVTDDDLRAALDEESRQKSRKRSAGEVKVGAAKTAKGFDSE